MGGRMLYMIIEHFRDGDPVPVYRRLRDEGRLVPQGLRYVASWVTEDFRRCFQIMECEDRALLAQWTARWEDLIEFEVIPVVRSSEARPVRGHDRCAQVPAWPGAAASSASPRQPATGCCHLHLPGRDPRGLQHRPRLRCRSGVRRNLHVRLPLSDLLRVPRRVLL